MESFQKGDKSISGEPSRKANVGFENKLEEIELNERLRTVPFDKKVKTVYSYFAEQSTWRRRTLKSTKSTVKSADLRATGNKFFRDGRDKEALRIYTESAAVALPDSAELSLAFANRSAALYRLENYFASLQDINRSLSGQCPGPVRSKLVRRKEACLIKIDEENRFKNDLFSDFKRMQNEGGNGTTFFERDLQPLKLNPEETEPLDRLCDLPAMQSENNSLPNTNAKVELTFDSTYGNYVVSRQDIRTGEIIAHEKAFSSILDEQFRLTNCSFCFIKNDALIPCNGCALVLFCGENCRVNAYNMYHRVECEIADLLQEASYESPYHHFLPLRTLLVGSEQGKRVKQLMEDAELSNVLKNERESVVRRRVMLDYIAVCDLHRDIDNLPETILFGFVLKSAYFLHWLKQTSFFGHHEYCKELTEEEAFVGTLLLNHFLTLVFNAFSITEKVIPVAENGTTNHTIGICFYDLCSRFNHSCDPNADFYSNKNSMIVYAHRPIPAGEQVFISYETHYHSVSLPKRQTSLRKQYGFVCQCQSCKDDWPLYDNLPQRPTLLRNVKVTKKSMMRLYEKYENLWSGDTKSDVCESLLQFLFEFSTIVHDNFEAPLQLQVVCQSGIEKFLSMKGNFYLDCYDVRKRVDLLLTEHEKLKSDAEKLRLWIRDFLMAL